MEFLFFVVRFQDDLEYTIEILDPKFPTIFIENDPELADGAFEDAWEQLCAESGKLTF